MTMTALWRNVSVNVVVNSNWSCLLISAPKVHWRVQPTAGRFNKMHGALRHCTCLSTVPPRELFVSAWKEQYTPNNSPNWNGMEISCLESYAWSYFESFIRSPEHGLWIKNRMGQFSTGPTNKAVPSFRNSLIRVNERWRKTLWAFISTQKVFALTAFALSWIAETILDNVSTAKLPWLKAA